MQTYILRRLIISVAQLLGAATLVFFMIRLVPGDPAGAILGESANQEQIQAIRAQLGLDRPLIEQYTGWLGKLFRGDLGQSLISGRSIGQDVAYYFPRTLELALSAFLIGVLIGIPNGVLAAVWRDRPPDLIATSMSLVGLSVPNFVLGTLLIILFGLWLRWFPPTGYIPWEEDWGAHLKVLILPALALSIHLAAVVTRMTRSTVLEVLGLDFVRTARGKGLGEQTVLFRHALRNALIPVVSLTGVQFGTLLGGSVVVEQVFRWPGISTMLLNAVSYRDYPTVQAVVLLVCSIFIIVNLGVDLVNGFLDPRIRYR